MLARLHTIAPDQWLAVHQIIADILPRAEERHRRRFHRPKMITMRLLLIGVFLASGA